jgi:hypothetical protein
MNRLRYGLFINRVNSDCSFIKECNPKDTVRRAERQATGPGFCRSLLPGIGKPKAAGTVDATPTTVTIVDENPHDFSGIGEIPGVPVT